MQLRRARTLLSYWHDGKMVLENYRTRASISADALAMPILDFFSQWRRPEELFAHLPGFSRSSVRAALRQLMRHTLLVEENTPAARDEENFVKAWSAWLPHGSFHFSTKDAEFARGSRATRLMRKFLAESPQPAFGKAYPRAPKLKLPIQEPPAGEFLRTLMERKTYRQFSRRGISLADLATLLYYTWGVTGSVYSPMLGHLPHKTSPSGGARHPVEVYVVALDVRGLAPGIYHYDARSHRLELLRRGNFRRKVVPFCAGQEWVGKAAALFLMTAVFPRSMWKYRSPRAYRVVLLDAGHLCQTFCLAATWMGLGPFCTAALKDTLIEKELGIDGYSESVLYVAGVGRTASRRGQRKAASRRFASE